MPEIQIALYGLLIVVLLQSLTWIVSLFRHDVSIADTTWSLLLLATCLLYFQLNEYTTLRGQVVTVLVFAWALRLSIHITRRNWGEGEDRRYQTIRRNNSPNFALRSLWIVFILQGVLAWIVSLSLLPAVTSSRPWNLLDTIAVLLVVFGVVFEAVADAQLSAFRADPANRHKVLNQGLWRYSRHPNYFGEFCVWWGFYLFSMAAGTWWTIISPLLMSVLLLRVSGVTLLEKTITGRRPGYAAYAARTSTFFPRPPGVQ